MFSGFFFPFLEDTSRKGIPSPSRRGEGEDGVQLRDRRSMIRDCGPHPHPPLSLKEGSSLSAPIFVEYGKAGETSEIGRRHRFPLA